MRIVHPPVEPWVFCDQTYDDEEFEREFIPGTEKRYTAKDTAGNTCHAGFDLQAPIRERTLFAVCDGDVATVDFGRAYGTQTVIRSADSNRRAGAFYAHQARRLVRAGTTVTFGQPIGVMGKTSSATIGIHLHFSWCPKWNVARFENVGMELRSLKEAFMPYTKEKDELLQRILDDCTARNSRPAGAFTGPAIDLIRKLGPKADALLKLLEKPK